ncbi:rCG38401 [Rattus norvegicus]|uniref:RCG38401 n=1 Tax=Rattus norvegicus TaxID=10116 RepID=A6MGW3_RAT|nr:rCG45356 [Rattus norvegicus]EDL82788.1 rCG52263 [Rattus norvegicus]EDL83924.1 rCG38401 [Rattus norvegicus]
MCNISMKPLGYS